MERTKVLNMMSGLKLYWMKSAYDQTLATALKRKHESQRSQTSVRVCKLDRAAISSRSRSRRSRRARSSTSSQCARAVDRTTPPRCPHVHSLKSRRSLSLRDREERRAVALPTNKPHQAVPLPGSISPFRQELPVPRRAQSPHTVASESYSYFWPENICRSGRASGHSAYLLLSRGVARQPMSRRKNPSGHFIRSIAAYARLRASATSLPSAVIVRTRPPSEKIEPLTSRVLP